MHRPFHHKAPTEPAASAILTFSHRIQRAKASAFGHVRCAQLSSTFVIHGAQATGGLPDDLSDEEKIAQRYARQLSAEHHVDAALYSAAERAFGHRGLVEIAYLTGAYHTVCALLNAFEIPAPR